MRSEKGLVMETKLKSQKEAKNVYLEVGVLTQIARGKRSEKRRFQSGADLGAEPDINTGVGVGAEAEKEEETGVKVVIEEEIGVRAMTEEKEEDLVLKRRKTGKRIGVTKAKHC